MDRFTPTSWDLDARIRILQAVAPGADVTATPSKRFGDRARMELPDPRSVKFAYLDEDKRLRLNPADTLGQARLFYSDARALERVKKLADSGWTLEPNFHFGFMAKGLVWTTSSLDAHSYMDYWRDRIEELAEWERPEWDIQLEELVDAGIFDPADTAKFEKAFKATKRQTASPRPGLALISDYQDAADADLSASIARRLREALTAVGDPTAFIWPT